MRTYFPLPNLNKVKPLAVTLSAVLLVKRRYSFILAKNRLSSAINARSWQEIFALPSWHDCGCMSDANASEDPGDDPLYEPIVDYCIDSRLGPGYSSPQRSD
jgi:hypothetical protein